MNNFIDQALIFIASAIILVPLFKQLGFGSVLGYLIAGVLVGPHCFKLIHDSESVMHFAELGVVFLLFIIGLEIQPRKLWSMRRQLFGLGLLQIFGCTAIFCWIGMLWGLDQTAAVVMGFGLSLSSTAFAIQTMSEKNQLGTDSGQASFAVLLMQDLVAIPALALIPTLAKSDSVSSEGSINAWAFLVVVIMLVLLNRFLMGPLFKMIAKMRSREIFMYATLFIVFGVATLMLKIGLSAALGTFIAGVLLADSQYRHELEVSLEPFKSLLMGLFFIGVGMSVSLDLIIAKPLLVLSLSLGYMLLKIMLIYGVGRMTRMNHENAKLMSLNIGQGGEFAFVIFGLALTFKLVPQDLLILFTAIVTISMALSPLFILFNERLTQRCRPMEIEKKYDEIKDENPQVIIAGFGRFGQIFGRMLRGQGIPFVAMDHDPDQIDLLRKFGTKVYYGDVSRLDLLEAAGAAKAKYFILAIDDSELSMKTAKILVENFPKLKIFARARNRGHVYDLMELGITHIKRETFDSSLSFVGDLLIDLGFSPQRSELLLKRFKEHDELMLLEQYKVRNDDKDLVSVSQQGQAQLAEILNNESNTSYIR